MNLNSYLKSSEIVDFNHPSIVNLSKKLIKNISDKEQIAKIFFQYIRDEIRHSGDCKDNKTTLKASEVLEYKTGWCYSKSILLVALLRLNEIPAGFTYQKLKCDEYIDDTFCIHALVSIYLEKYGWYRVDARGNKKGVDAQFTPPIEQLAFEVNEKKGEIDDKTIYTEPVESVIDALKKNSCYELMINNFPSKIV